MKKTIYFLLAFLFLSAFSFEARAQAPAPDRSALGKRLYEAADDKKTDAALDLIKQGADLNYLGEYGTPVDRAALNNDFRLVKALLEAGADANLSQPIHNAVYIANAEMVELFIKYKADVNGRNENGYNSLHIAALWNNDEKVTALLLKAGADPKVVAKDSHTPLSIAQSERKPKIAALLVGGAGASAVKSESRPTAAKTGEIQGAALYKLYLIEKPLPAATDYSSLEANYHQQVVWRTDAVMENINEVKKVTADIKKASPDKLIAVQFSLSTRVLEARAHIKEAIRELSKLNNPRWQEDRKFYDEYLEATESIAKQLNI